MSEYPRVRGVVTQQGTDISELCNRLADEHAFPPRVMVAGGIAESDLHETAARWGIWPDVSFGAWQQTVAYAPIGDQSASAANVAYVQAFLNDVTQAAEIAAPQFARFWHQYQSGPECLGRYNWPARGLQGNPNRANIERAWAASARYIGEDPPAARTYNPDTPAERQRQEWTCSVRSATFLEKSLGFTVAAEQMQDEMVAAGLVSPQLGLLDGSGAALATWLSQRFGVPAAAAWVDWAWLQAHAGTAPIAIGGLAWNHWTPVRRVAADGGLELANPAPGYRGVYDHLSAGDFARLGPFAAVYIAVEAATEEDELSAEERNELEQLRSTSASLLHDTLEPIAATLDTALKVKGAKGWGKVAEVRESLRTNVGV